MRGLFERLGVLDRILNFVLPDFCTSLLFLIFSWGVGRFLEYHGGLLPNTIAFDLSSDGVWMMNANFGLFALFLKIFPADEASVELIIWSLHSSFAVFIFHVNIVFLILIIPMIPYLLLKVTPLSYLLANNLTGLNIIKQGNKTNIPWIRLNWLIWLWLDML
jgi:hypothetical protein